MIKRIKNFVRNHLINIPGWKTDRKIVVIESDDWGMIRMASKEAYDWFLDMGYNVNECPVNRNDALESNDDLELLFDVLSSFKDSRGHPAVFTANNIVANPDFKKIQGSNFTKYYYEPFTKTLDRYPGRDKVMKLYREGIDQNLFFPQFHGREHLNVNRWMTGLRAGSKVLKDALEHDMFTVHRSGSISCKRDNLDAFGMRYEREWINPKEVIQTGLDLFEDIWGFRSSSFIAPCYIWPVEIEKFLFHNKIKYIQGTHVQKVPKSDINSGIKRKYHYMGQENNLGQRYLIRNVSFEPALHSSEEPVSKAIEQIGYAFKYKKPAIICTHRFNYMGSIHKENRDRNLELLKKLLKKIKKKWPDVEFMTTCELGKCIENKL